MILATKRAVGSDYAYQPYYREKFEQQKQTKVRIKKRPSPLLVVALGISLIGIMFFTGLSYTYLKARIAHLNWQISQGKKEIAAMQVQNEKLELEIARLKSLDRIEKVATTQMGMIKNPGVEYLAIKATTNTSVPASQTVREMPAQDPANTSQDGIITAITKVISEKAGVGKG
ncbi:MAG: Septum formation initiator [Peptococcaceae bacterium]|nr:Septum formation initiator [Peptococcaceae bacterium]